MRRAPNEVEAKVGSLARMILKAPHNDLAGKDRGLET